MCGSTSALCTTRSLTGFAVNASHARTSSSNAIAPETDDAHASTLDWCHVHLHRGNMNVPIIVIAGTTPKIHRKVFIILFLSCRALTTVLHINDEALAVALA